MASDSCWRQPRGGGDDGRDDTTTTYYYAGSSRVAEAVNGSFTYLASDGLGSAEVALSAASQSASASLLYAPYGTVRYSSGTMPTDYGFTGQHADAATGLDYDNARYYDPLAGQFASPDTILPGGGFDILGLSRFAYVGGQSRNADGSQRRHGLPEWTWVWRWLVR